MTTEDLMKLRELAEAATPGAWIAGDDEDSDYFLVGPHDGDEIVYQPVVKLHAQNNAEYIAAANPAKVIELLDALEALGREVAELKDRLESSVHGQNQTFDLCKMLEAERDTLRAELAAIRAQGVAEDLSFMEFMNAEDAMFEQIDIAARKSFRRHQSSVKGQMFTRADGFDSHLVWAALDWAKKHNASPAAKDAGLVAALKDAATSLETISRLAGRTHYVGDDGERVETYMGHHDQVRGYATSRASVARNELSKIGGV